MHAAQIEEHGGSLSGAVATATFLTTNVKHTVAGFAEFRQAHAKAYSTDRAQVANWRVVSGNTMRLQQHVRIVARSLSDFRPSALRSNFPYNEDRCSELLVSLPCC
jgi:hypothetical protein